VTGSPIWDARSASSSSCRETSSLLDPQRVTKLQFFSSCGKKGACAPIPHTQPLRTTQRKITFFITTLSALKKNSPPDGGKSYAVRPKAVALRSGPFAGSQNGPAALIFLRVIPRGGRPGLRQQVKCTSGAMFLNTPKFAPPWVFLCSLVPTNGTARLSFRLSHKKFARAQPPALLVCGG